MLVLSDSVKFYFRSRYFKPTDKVEENHNLSNDNSAQTTKKIK